VRVEVNFFINYILCIKDLTKSKAHRNWRCEIQRNMAEAITKKEGTVVPTKFYTKV
jgi:hypothetical protein